MADANLNGRGSLVVIEKAVKLAGKVAEMGLCKLSLVSCRCVATPPGDRRRGGIEHHQNLQNYS